MIKSVAIVLFLLLSTLSVLAQKGGAFEKQIYVDEGDTLLFQILYPENYDPGQQYPLLLFLHGAGERGQDNERQMNLGGSLFTQASSLSEHPAIVVFPQCPDDIMWTARQKHQNKRGQWVFDFPLNPRPQRPAELVNQLMENLISTDQVDANRVYIMGISMGGIGTLEFLYRWPEKYAAAAVICGGNDHQLSDKYADVPIWFFHGGIDDVVPPKYSRKVYKRLKRKNSETRYTLYSEANHNSWDAALAEPELLNWLFNFKK